MSEPAIRKAARFNWADYQTWNDNQRWEIVGGEAYLMSPSPSFQHQQANAELLRQMANHFRGKVCRVIAAPMDVVLSEEDVVQPDLLVVCDKRQIKRTHVLGPPRLVVEIVSASSEHLDRMIKMMLYARAGVGEYWIVTPWPHMVEVLVLRDGKYVVHGVFGKNTKLTSPSFPGLAITLKHVFDFPLGPDERPPVVRETPAPYPAARKTRR